MDETGNLPGPVETHEPAEPHCHNCGAPHDRFQEYCLECGARLTPLPQQSGGAGPGSPYWFWASLIALLVLALITAAVVIAATDDDDGAGASSGVSTLPATVVPTGLTTETLGPPTLPTSSGFVPTVPEHDLRDDDRAHDDGPDDHDPADDDERHRPDAVAGRPERLHGHPRVGSREPGQGRRRAEGRGREEQGAERGRRPRLGQLRGPHRPTSGSSSAA